MGFLDIFSKRIKDIDDKYVFDKAKYHFESVEEAGLDLDQAYVHTGLFLTWLVNNGLVSDFFIEETSDEIAKLKEREILPSEIYKNWDGVLIGELLNKEGYNFALDYFDFEKGSYMHDYERIFCPGEEPIFGVEDNWENYDRIKPAIDLAYSKWKK